MDTTILGYIGFLRGTIGTLKVPREAVREEEKPQCKG